jgi:hypothetical protein
VKRTGGRFEYFCHLFLDLLRAAAVLFFGYHLLIAAEMRSSHFAGYRGNNIFPLINIYNVAVFSASILGYLLPLCISMK